MYLIFFVVVANGLPLSEAWLKLSRKVATVSSFAGNHFLENDSAVAWTTDCKYIDYTILANEDVYPQESD